MNVYCLYFPDGKRYVGVESKTGQRINGHRLSNPNKRGYVQQVTKAIARHGWDTIKWRYLMTNCSRKDGLRLERALIKHFRTQEPEWGYNIARGANEHAPKLPGFTELRFHINDRLVESLRRRTGAPRAADVARDAFAFLDWATQEAAAGYRVMAVNDAGEKHLPIMDALQPERY